MHNFNNVRIGQKAFILNSKGEMLILKRANAKVFNNYWDVPGGKVEENDTLFEAISREILEETALKLKEITAILTTSKFTGSYHDKPIILRNIYLCKATGIVKLSHEHSEFKWINPEDVVKYEFPDDLDFQHALKQIRKLRVEKIKPVSKVF